MIKSELSPSSLGASILIIMTILLLYFNFIIEPEDDFRNRNHLLIQTKPKIVHTFIFLYIGLFYHKYKYINIHTYIHIYIKT